MNSATMNGATNQLTSKFNSKFNLTKEQESILLLFVVYINKISLSLLCIFNKKILRY